MKNSLNIALVGLLFIFLLLNIVSSQTVSSLFFDIAHEDPLAAVSFLHLTKRLPGFEEYKKTFTFDVLHQFTVEEFNQQREIRSLERLLEKNPSARDVLYRLSLFYEQEGNQARAQEYLNRAQEIDPNIK